MSGEPKQVPSSPRATTATLDTTAEQHAQSAKQETRTIGCQTFDEFLRAVQLNAATRVKTHFVFIRPDTRCTARATGCIQEVQHDADDVDVLHAIYTDGTRCQFDRFHLVWPTPSKDPYVLDGLTDSVCFSGAVAQCPRLALDRLSEALAMQERDTSSDLAGDHPD